MTRRLPTAPAAALPSIPKVELEIVADRSADADRHFLEIRRLDLVTVRAGARSAPFRYDIVDRRALDASVMVAHHARDGRVHVYLRSAIRPPVALRDALPEAASPGLFWEVPAGLIEPGESPRASASRELAEELGFDVPEERLEALGHWAAPAPGFVGEVHHYFHVRVDPETRKEPSGDGSPLEHDASVISVPLDDALDACRSGAIRDAKTELALRRLAEALGPG